MNKNNIYNWADDSYNLSKNTMKIHKGQTLQHCLAIFLTLYEQVQNGNDVYTELIFKRNVGRADVFVPNIETAFEITESEKDNSIEEKKKVYPCDVTALKAKDVVNYWVKQLEMK